MFNDRRSRRRPPGALVRPGEDEGWANPCGLRDQNTRTAPSLPDWQEGIEVVFREIAPYVLVTVEESV